jgi:hypothetical protein
MYQSRGSYGDHVIVISPDSSYYASVDISASYFTVSIA